MRKSTLNLVLTVICVGFLSLTLIPLVLSYHVGPQITRRILVQRVQKLLQGTVEVERAGITIFVGFGVEYKNLRILGPEQEEIFRTEAFLLKPLIKSLVLGRLRWKRVVLKNPSIYLTRNPDGRFSSTLTRNDDVAQSRADFYGRLRDRMSSLPSQLSIQGGRIRLGDLGISDDTVATEINQIELEAESIPSEGCLSFTMAGISVGGMDERFSISGEVTWKGEGVPPNQAALAISLVAHSIDSQWIWPYIRSSLPVNEARGLLDLNIMCRAGQKSFASSGQIKIRHGYFSLPELYTAPIEPQEASLDYELEYEKGTIHVSRLAIDVPHVSVRGHVTLEAIGSGTPSISLEFTTAKAALKHIGPYLPDKLVPKNVLPLLTDPGVQGAIRVQKAKLEGPWADLNVEGLKRHPEMLFIETQLDNCTFQVNPKLPPLRKISGLVRLRGEQATISGFRAQFRRSYLLDLNGSVSHVFSHPTVAASFRGELDLRGIHSFLNSNQLAIDIRKTVKPITKISGKASMAGEIRHTFSKPSDLTYKCRISLKNVRVSIAGRSVPLTDLVGEIRGNEEEILFSDFRWRMGRSLFHGHASLRSYLKKSRAKFALSKKMRISFDLEAKEISIDDLLLQPGTDRIIRIDPTSLWLNSTILGRVGVSKGSFKEFQFTDLEASFALKGGRLEFKSFRAEAPGGFLRCKGWINLKSEQTVSFKLIPIIRGLELTNVMKLFSAQGKGHLISGKLDMEGIIAGHGNSADRIIRSLGGDFWLDVEGGVIHGLKPGKGKNEGVPYRRATGGIMIEEGVASTEGLHLDGEAISMAIKGRANLKDRSLDVLIAVRPLQTVDRILSNIPIAGWILAGKDRSILTFSYRIRGPFDRLRVENPMAQSQKPIDR